ncbi:fatty acyl-CoA reductase wat-like [Uranotaenia lowii]|uniref:fatty acyl-CoA reductase wat-like n=1 Tax=Uranotaenia lowii TaxID=190385 RepID=UPI00247A5E1A|nr:fatty acyl-CoA reductase wat-like [Uranotaenia lowii]
MATIFQQGVRQFYKDSVILMAGVTGFLGQTLLEKTIRSLEPRKVYLLIRGKKNQSAEQRLEKMMNGVIFEKSRNLPVVKTIQPLQADMTRKDLGLELGVRQKLMEDVNVVFNMAAAVNSNLLLKDSLQHNVENNLNLFNLVDNMKNLKSAVHTSTMYVDCRYDLMEERIIDDVPFGGYDRLKLLMSNLSDAEQKAITPFIIKDHITTYGLAKKITEVELQRQFSHKPIGIFRPPFISSVLREPLPGWINNLYATAGPMAMAALGIFSPWYYNTSKKPMLAPVDYCANALLLSARDIHQNFFSNKKTIPVYNYATLENAPTYGQMLDNYLEGMGPFKKFLYQHLMSFRTTNPRHYKVGVEVMRWHASALDRLRLMRGCKPVLRRLVDNVYLAVEKSSYIPMRDWPIENGNVRWLQQGLSEEEIDMFYCDLSSIDWETYQRKFLSSFKKYALQEKIDGI